MNKIWSKSLSVFLVLAMILSMVPAAAFAVASDDLVDVSYKWDGNTLYIKDGAITGADFIKAVQEKTGSTYSTVYYSATDLKTPIAFRGAGTQISSGTTYTALADGSTYYASTYYRSGLSVKGTVTGAFTVEYYNVFTIASEVDGAYVTYNGTNYYVGDKFVYTGGTITAGEVDGYTANAVTVPSTSGTLNVSYVSNEAPKHDVTLNVVNGEFGSAELSESGQVSEKTDVIITATPKTSTESNVSYYIASIEVNGATLNGNTFTVGEEDVTVTVTFGKKELTGNTSVEVAVNGRSKDGIKEKVLAAVLGEGYTGTYKVYMYANIIIGTDYTDSDTFIYAGLDVPGTEQFKIVDENGLELYVTAKIVESRTAADISLNGNTFQADTEEAFIDAVKDAVSVTDNNGNVVSTALGVGYTVSVEATDVPFAYTVTVKVNDGTDHLGTTKTFTAVWVVNEYTVTWVNEDGTLLDEQDVAYGETPVYGGAIPTKASDAQYDYEFAGWAPEISPVNGDITYVATYTATTRSYTITWVDGNGNVIDTDTVLYGELPVYDYATYGNPVKDSTEEYSYTWDGGWEPVVEAVTGDATYTATFTSKNVYTVSFDTAGGSAVEMQKVIEGNTASETATPVREGYRFDGWLLNDEAYDFDTVVSGDITLVAKWVKQVTVTFQTNGADEIASQTFDIGGVATQPADPDKDYAIFNGWTLNGEAYDFAAAVTEDITLVANWIEDSNNNEVLDAEETIYVSINGNGTVYFGSTAVTDGMAYVYDSTQTVTVTIVAEPVTALDGLKRISETYVSGLSVDGSAVALTYAENYSVSYTFTANDVQTVSVTFTDAGYEWKEDGVLNYYDGMTGVKNEDVYNTAVNAPDYNDAKEVIIEYLAREATSVSVSLDSLDINSTLKSILKYVVGDSFTFDMDDLWLEVNVELGGQIQESVSLDQAVATYLTSERINALYETFKAAADANGGLILGAYAGYEAVKAELEDLYATIYGAAMYHGAHNFGYNATGAETIDETIRITYTCDAYRIMDTTTITLKDLRAASFIKGENVEVIYRDYLDADLMEMIGAVVVDENGNVIVGAEATCIEITAPYSFEGKNVSETAYELTFKFAGNDTFKPCEGTVTVTVVKASASINVPDVNITYGDAYSTVPSVALGNKYGEASELTDSMIEFVLGLDVSELTVDENGISGVSGKVQLLLPESLSSIMDLVGLEDGMSMKLSDLKKYLESADDLLGTTDPSNQIVSTLNGALDALIGLVDAGDLEITIGGGYPTDIGVYLYGAVTTNGNYETAFDMGYIVIKPEATQVYLDWNHHDDNAIWTWMLLQYNDLGATAYGDSAFTTVVPEANEKVMTLFAGVDENGELVYTWDASELGTGAYTEIAFIADFGNAFFYCEPIIRAFVIVPDAVEIVVDNVDVVYDGNQHGIGNFTVVDLEGNEMDATAGDVTIRYVGITAAGETYVSTEAPVDAGIYEMIATYISYTDDGDIHQAGFGVGTLTIEKAPLNLDLEDTTVTWDGEVHFVDVTNPHNGDYVTAIINREDGSVNFILEEDAMALLALLEQKLGITIPTSANVGEMIAMIDEVLANFELVYDALPDSLKSNGAEVLTTARQILAELPNVGIVSINGNLPSEIGTYECYALTYSYNYRMEVSRGYLNILPIQIEVIVENDTKVYGEVNPIPSYVVKYYDHLGNELTGFEIDIDVTISREEGENVGIYYYAVEACVEDVHYEIAAVTMDAYLEIVPAKITITANDASKVYGEADPELTATVEGLVGNDVLNVTLKREAGENVGTYVITAYAENANYEITFVNGTFEITKKSITVTANDASKVYGEADPELTATVEGLVGNDVLNVTLKREAGENVSTYVITAYAENANYEITFVNGTFEITKKSITVTANDASKVYGEADPELAATIEGLVGNDVLNVTLKREAGENVGTYVITAYAENANYEISFVDGIFEITKKAVTITAEDASKVYGEADPELAATIEGLVGADVLDVTLKREAGENVGTYVITAYAENANYEITFVDGAFQITKATVTITIESAEALAGTATPDVNYSIVCDGVVTADELGLSVVWNAKTFNGLVHGVYDYIIRYNDPAEAPDNWDVIVNEGATLTVTLGDYVCWNLQTGVYYDDLSDALADVDDETTIETIQMLKSYEEKYVIVAPGTTLDLNGFIVTAKFVSAFEGAHVIDNTRKGLLKVAQNNIDLATGNAMVPVWNTVDGYMFTQLAINDSGSSVGMTKNDDGSVTFEFIPFFLDTALLKDNGVSDNDLSIIVRLTWTSEDGVASQDFVYNDDMVKDVIAANGKKSLEITIQNYANYEGLTVTAMVLSGTDAAFAGTVYTANLV